MQVQKYPYAYAFRTFIAPKDRQEQYLIEALTVTPKWRRGSPRPSHSCLRHSTLQTHPEHLVLVWAESERWEKGSKAEFNTQVHSTEQELHSAVEQEAVREENGS